jgi:hypothetical protein
MLSGKHGGYMAECLYSDYAIAIRESMKALLSEDEKFSHLDNRALNSLVEIALAALKKAGLSIAQGNGDA